MAVGDIHILVDHDKGERIVSVEFASNVNSKFENENGSVEIHGCSFMRPASNQEIKALNDRLRLQALRRGC